MALLRRSQVKTLVLFLGTLALLACGTNANSVVDKNNVFDVTKFGARPDGTLDSALAFRTAWKTACQSSKNSTVLIPRGTYVTSEVKFEGKCNNTITLNVQGAIVVDGNRKSGRETKKQVIDEYTLNCKRQAGKACGEKIFNDVFYRKVRLDDSCCKRVMKMGKDCHQHLFNMASALPQFSPIATAARTRNEEIWSRCERIGFES